MAMTVQEPQLLDKMENVAYGLKIQADERKKHMNSRYCYAHSIVKERTQACLNVEKAIQLGTTGQETTVQKTNGQTVPE